jgi:hypothetical protein
MKDSVLGGIDELLEKQRQQMRGEEAAALRQLRCRLAEVEALLRAEREQQGKGHEDLRAKTVGWMAAGRCAAVQLPSEAVVSLYAIMHMRSRALAEQCRRWG